MSYTLDEIEFDYSCNNCGSEGETYGKRIIEEDGNTIKITYIDTCPICGELVGNMDVFDWTGGGKLTEQEAQEAFNKAF